MTESKALTVFSRFIAEFFVIVLGVLVALGVDEWRDAEADVQRESEYLRELVKDLERDIREYEDSQEFITDSIEAIDYVLAVISQSEAEKPYSSYAVALRRANWVNYPAWSTGTLSELVNSGAIRLIRNPELKRSMLDYYQRVEEWRPRIMGREYATFIEFRRHIAGWLPPEMNAFSEDELTAAELAQLDEILKTRSMEDDEFFALISGMREDWSLIAGFMEYYGNRAAELKNQVELALQAE